MGLARGIPLCYLGGDVARDRKVLGREHDRIESWGEIAAYLKRDVTTVQRWEQKSGLPVHRMVVGRGRPSVYAYPSEIDRWLASASLTESGSTRPLPPGLADESLTESRPGRIQRWAIAGAAIAVVATIGLLGGSGPEPGRGGSPLVRPLTHYPGDEIQPALSPDGRQVAFSWDGNIHVQLTDSARPLQLTDTPDLDVRPEWSPDGSQIAFTRQYADGQRREILVVPVLGGATQRLVEARPGKLLFDGFAWSPDGRYVAFIAPKEDSEDSFEGVSLFSFADRTVRRLTDPTSLSELAVDRFPAFSPDGTRVAVIRYGFGPPRSVIVDLDGRELYAFPTEATGRHAWLPDGQSLVFMRQQAGLSRLRRWRPAEGRVEDLSFGTTDVLSPTIRGDRLAFSRRRYDSNLRGLDLNGAGAPSGALQVLTRTTSRENSPTFSPDGSQIAFISNRSGANEIWVCDRDGGSPKQLTYRNAGSPQWSPDGRWIAFDSAAPGQRPAVFVVNAQGGEPRGLTPPGQEARVPSWSRDGQWIYFAGGKGFSPRGTWRVPARGGEAVLVNAAEQGAEAVEAPDGRRVLLRPSHPGPNQGVRTVDLATGEIGPFIIDHVRDRYWAVTDEAVYYVQGHEQLEQPRPFEVKRYDLAEGTVTHVATLDFQMVQGPPGLAVAPDESMLVVTSLDLYGRNLVLVEGFE